MPVNNISLAGGRAFDLEEGPAIAGYRYICLCDKLSTWNDGWRNDWAQPLLSFNFVNSQEQNS